MQRLTCEILVVLLYDPNVSAVFPAARCRAVATALMGGGGLNIHIFMSCPIDFFSNQVDFKRN